LSLWLAKTKRGLLVRAVVGVPMVFMMGITVPALVLQILTSPNAALTTLAVVLLLLAL
jgi:hypothetical protein